MSAMLELAFKISREGIYIQTRHDADIFNLSQFKESQSPNQEAVAQSAEDIQKLINSFAKATAQFSLKINIKKTDRVFIPAGEAPPLPSRP